MAKKKEHVFGPVPSRRLGRSLGIDLVPYKTCSYDCLYCQVGRTTEKTTKRQYWVDVDEIIVELKEKLATEPDYITLSGSGEPTLFAECGRLIAEMKKITDVPIAVITNGSILSNEKVKDEILQADLVVPSLDAADEETFKKIDRPAETVIFSEMLNGLIEFRKIFKGQYWLEIFFIDGINDNDNHVAKLADCIKKINPDKIQLNTVTRPPTDDVKAVSAERLGEIAKVFGPKAEVIAAFHSEKEVSEFRLKDTDITEMLKRRPCSAKDIAGGLNVPLNEALKHIGLLVEQNKITPVRRNDDTYYKVV